ncbi:hypothetical protein J7K44_03190 [bacterium]|nr:hypothetical protein [bacterium]
MNFKYILTVLIVGIFTIGGVFRFEKMSEIESPPVFVNLSNFSKKKIERKEGKREEKKISSIQGLTEELLQEKIEQGKEFLFKMEDPKEHGFHKYYYALEDRFEERVHTVYSASIIYTFLKIYDFDKDKRILEKLPSWMNFLLSMQNKSGKERGAFHYSFYLKSKEKEQKFVVGTTALSIFTLLDLYERNGNVEYLEAAKLGGNWLIKMQRENGSMIPYKKYRDNKWFNSTKESLLYNGQVLSALSRLYKVTQEEKYYNAAEKIAKRFVEKVKKEGCYLGDDYRIKNPISSAWVVMSLLDFYKISREDLYKDIIFRCSSELLKRQNQDKDNVLLFGSWQGAYSSSGNGWLAEVMTEVFHFCQKEGRKDCNKYKEAVLRVIWWLIQNTYSKENTSSLPNPERAVGGLFWNNKEKYVRTDSVCHALNAYLGIIDDLEEESEGFSLQ